MKRPVTAAAIALAATLAFAAPAFAHVEVTPEQAARGSTATLTFRVPNEKDNASTTKVEIVLPPEHPVTTLTPQPVAGWTESTSGTASVAWTADAGGGIAPDAVQNFVIAVGPLPSDTDTFVFKALQTYSDGEVVRWIEATPPGGAEPDFPAPTLTLTGPAVPTTAAPSTVPASASTTAASGVSAAPTTAAAHDSDSGVSTGSVIGIVIVVVLALAAGGYSLGRSRRRG